jgi:uncharacterized protein (TIGR02466 family)
MNIDKLFPISIYRQENLLDKDELEELSKVCLDLQGSVPKGGNNWKSDVYNTQTTFDLRDHKAFDKIVRLVTKHVHDFAKLHGSAYEYKCTDSWFNVYNKHDGQEFHTHNDDIFSAIFYVKSPVGSSSTIFKAPFDQRNVKNMYNLTELNNTEVGYYPNEGGLLIFRSYVPHMVQQHQLDEQRISLAFNFN